MTELDPAVAAAKLPLTQDWTVVAFKEGKTEFNQQAKGNLTAFYVDFVGEDKTEVGDVYWRRKEGNAPEVNKPVFGVISQGNYGPMFRLQQRDGGDYQRPQQQGQQQQQGQLFDAERQRQIMRQRSQKMALRLIESTRDAGDLDLSNSDLVSAYLREVVQPLTDWFEKDLEKK